MELAKAYVQIIPSAEGIKGKIGKELGDDADNTGKSYGGKMTDAIKKVITTAAIGKALSASITEGANLQQSIGGIETLFKESADKVKQNAAEAYRTAGMSANEYMELTTSFSASLLQSLGNDTAKAADIADMAMTDMSDNANKMGTDMESIKNAYQGFAKQNYTMLDNLKLGYGGTKTEMERLLKDAQELSGVEYDINNLSDVYSAIHVIQGELDITGTTGKEAASTISGSFNSMKAAFKNVMGEITLGMDLGPALSALAETVVTFLVGNLLPAIWNILSALPGALVTFIMELAPQLIDALGTMLDDVFTSMQEWMQAAPQLYESAVEIVNQLVNGINENLPSLLQRGVDFIVYIVNGILQNIPSLLLAAGQIVTSLLNGISQCLPLLLQAGVQLILQIVSGIINNLPQVISAAAEIIVQILSTIAQNLPALLQAGIEIIGELAAGLIQAIPTLVGEIPSIITSVKETFTNYDWGSVGRNIISGIANGLRNAGHMLWDAVKGVLGSFKDNVLAFFGIHSPSTWGIYVGNMIDKGLANGLTDSASLVTDASGLIKDAVMVPFNEDLTQASISGQIKNNMRLQSASDSGYSSSANTVADYLKDFMESILTEEKDRQIILNLYLDKRLVAKAIAEPVEKQISSNNQLKQMMRGVRV